MTRQETARDSTGSTAIAAPRPALDPRAGLISLAGLILVLLLAARAGLAAEPADSVQLPGTPAVATNPTLEKTSEPKAGRPPAAASVDVELPKWALEDLLFTDAVVMGSWKPKTTDERLAAAIAIGNNPDLEPRKPFRKRSRDLFRTERPVSIGNAEMLVRLRIRAKARQAMSVELHF